MKKPSLWSLLREVHDSEEGRQPGDDLDYRGDRAADLDLPDPVRLADDQELFNKG